jgi:NTP pyrophosphatase (non-canonical NTP hydrolase)
VRRLESRDIAMELQDLMRRALEIRRQYAEQERASYGRAWAAEEIALGFVGDVGDLAKLVVACAGVRAIPDARAKLAHELADCLWSVLVLADVYGIDLEQAFLRTMHELEGQIGSGQ